MKDRVAEQQLSSIQTHPITSIITLTDQRLDLCGHTVFVLHVIHIINSSSADISLETLICDLHEVTKWSSVCHLNNDSEIVLNRRCDNIFVI